MTVEPNDSRLTALLLGELSDAERAALEAKVAASALLSEGVAGVRQTVEVLRSELAAEPCPHLSPVQREFVLREIATAAGTGGTAATGTWLALLGSIGWGAWGVWLTLAAASLLAVAGLLAWQVDWSRPEEKPPARVSADARKPPGDTTVAAIDESVPIGGRAADGPSITIRVGQSLRLSVLGQLENGREIALAADRLSWSTQPLADYVDFDPRSMTLTGLKATPQPVVLTVYFDGVAARVRVRVIHGESGTEERQNG